MKGFVAPVPRLFCGLPGRPSAGAGQALLPFILWLDSGQTREKLATPGQVAAEEVGLPGEMEARVGLEEE